MPQAHFELIAMSSWNSQIKDLNNLRIERSNEKVIE